VNSLVQGILLTVMGMLTVFVSLSLLAVMMRGIYALVAWWDKPVAAKAEKPAAQPQGQGVADAEGEDLSPVIAAAVGAYLEAESLQVFLVPVVRPDRSRWVMGGRVAALSRRDGS
jgi:sodium pump decarboxylase gamma subunit